jgi:beta-lactam-binding protein with PASTA domain
MAKPLTRWQRITIISVAGFIVFVLLMDKVVMPALVHSQAVVTMPNVIGSKIEDAKNNLIIRGFEIEKVDTHADEKIPAGAIIYQNPYAGAEVKKGRKVFITISSGRELMQMPQLVGIGLREAKIRAQMAGLAIGDINYEPSPSTPEEVVTAQSVPSGARVGINAKIVLTVSSGPERAQMTAPSLVGRTLVEAQELLINAKLVFGQISYRKDRAVLPSTVLEQHPAAGDTVREGTPVNLVVAGE